MPQAAPFRAAETRQPRAGYRGAAAKKLAAEYWRARATRTLQLCDISASNTFQDCSCCTHRQRIAQTHDGSKLNPNKQLAVGTPVSAAGAASHGGPRPAVSQTSAILWRNGLTTMEVNHRSTKLGMAMANATISKLRQQTSSRLPS